MAKVTQTWTGDASKLTAELDKVNRALAKNEEKLQNLINKSSKSGKASEEQARSMSRHAGGAALSLQSMATAWLSVGTAIGLANNFLQKQREIQEKSLDLNLQLAIQQQSLLLNTGTSFQSSIPQINAIQKRTNADINALTSGASFAVSAKGQLSTGEAFGALEAAARMVPNTPEAIPEFTQVALQIMNAAGPGELTAQQALGFAQSAATVAATPEAQQFFTSVAPVAFSGAIQDPTNRKRGMLQSAALMTMLTGRGDPGALLSATATANFVPRLGAFFKSRGGDVPESLFGRIEAMQQDPALREEFLESGGMKGRLPARLRTQVKNVLTAGTAEAEQMLAIAGKIGFEAAPYEERVAQIENATPALAIAARERASLSAEQRYQVETPSLGAAGAARRAVERGLGTATGIGGFLQSWGLQKAYNWYEGPMDPIGGGTTVLTRRRRGLELGGIQPDEVGQLKVIDEQLQVLKDLRDIAAQSQGQAVTGAANEQPLRHAEN